MNDYVHKRRKKNNIITYLQHFTTSVGQTFSGQVKN